MKSAAADRGLAAMAPAILYFVTGGVWVGIILDGGGSLLFWAALSCFLSGLFLLVWATSWVTRPLTLATALFGLALVAYQLFAALTLIGTGLDSVALITGAIFAVMTVIYLYLLTADLSGEREEKEREGKIRTA